jgi:GTPase SAR1 family protein
MNGLRKKFVVGLSPKKPLLQQRMGKTARVVLCGLKGVGKTAILEQLIYGNVTNSTVWMQLLFYVFSNM